MCLYNVSHFQKFPVLLLVDRSIIVIPCYGIVQPCATDLPLVCFPPRWVQPHEVPVRRGLLLAVWQADRGLPVSLALPVVEPLRLLQPAGEAHTRVPLCTCEVVMHPVRIRAGLLAPLRVWSLPLVAVIRSLVLFVFRPLIT
jgi:hypothetical protein